MEDEVAAGGVFACAGGHEDDDDEVGAVLEGFCDGLEVPGYGESEVLAEPCFVIGFVPEGPVGVEN